MMSVMARTAATIVMLFLIGVAAGQTTGKRSEPRQGSRNGPAATLPAAVSDAQSLSIILGRPTDKGITVSVLSADAREAFIEYGPSAATPAKKTEVQRLSAGVAVEFALDGLDRDARLAYRVQHRVPGQGAFVAGPAGSFQTQRALGSTFSFQIQGDSHPERPQMFDPTLYAQVLRSVAGDQPDFYMLIGDDFSADKLRTVSAETMRPVYLHQRYFLNLVGAPLFLVNGNHEQAARANLNGTPNNVAVLAQNARNALFPQPAPDAFYTGDAEKVEHIGLLRDYYAWTWGDALFVVIDPYWHSKQPVDNVFGQRDKGKRDLWGITLGDEQYKWFKTTLETSKAKYKFVFAHHVLGTGRGGIERAGSFEWGGKGNSGRDEFPQKRPGWELPIHQLMAKHGVTIFFQGHDHIFVRQELDGVVYQSLPVPADPNYALMNKDAYRTGDALPGSGRVRVTVSPDKVRVEYVRSYLPKDATKEHPDGEVAFRYEVPDPKKAKDQP